MENNSEIWKPVVGYDGVYEISSFGRVRSLERVVNNNHLVKERILKGRKNRCGYKQVTLYNKDGAKTFKVSRLVAIAFIPNPNNKPCVDHINTDRTNNRVENLRWCTHKENSNNPLTLNHIPRGDKHPKAGLGKYGKLNGHSIPIMQYTKDGIFIKEWESSLQVQREIGIWGSNITKCCKGGYKSTGGYVWKYKEVALSNLLIFTCFFSTI